jgi:hypothetical protein
MATDCSDSEGRRAEASCNDRLPGVGARRQRCPAAGYGSFGVRTRTRPYPDRRGREARARLRSFPRMPKLDVPVTGIAGCRHPGRRSSQARDIATGRTASPALATIGRAQHAEPRDGSGSVAQPRRNHATLKGTADRTAAVPPADDKRHDRIVQGRHAGECVAPDVGVAFSQPPRSQPESDERARGRGHGELEAGRMRGEAGAGTG